jgi:hypothetical protein
MSRELAQDGVKRALHYASTNYQEAFEMNRLALQQVQVERLMLMAEREVIDEYNKDYPSKNQSGTMKE